MTAILSHCPASVYHADRGSVSASSLKLFQRAPVLFRRWQRGEDTARTQTPAMRKGSLVHTLALEPQRFAESWQIVPHDAPRRPSITQREAVKPSPATVAAIEFWDTWDANLGDRTAIDPEEFEEAETIAESCFANEAIGKLLRAEGEVEPVILWTDAITGIACKARLDKLLPGLGVFDLKTCADASYEGFQRQALALGYHIQAAHYLAAAEALTGTAGQFFFGAVETSEPHLTHCFRASADFIAHGQSERRKLLDALAKCVETGKFVGLADGITELSLPHWLAPEIHE